MADVSPGIDNVVKVKPFRRTAGMRLAIPDFLLSSFKVLEHEGFRIAQRRPGTKRSIKFDDATRTLALDIKLPDSAAWVRIMAEDVHHAAATRKKQRVPAVSELLAIYWPYKSMIRPIAEYCSSVFFSMLTASDSLELERVQMQALKGIYGWRKSYRELLALSDVGRLDDRRETAFIELAKTCLLYTSPSPRD